MEWEKHPIGVTDDPRLMAEPARMYMEEGTPDPELYEYATSRFSVRFPPDSHIGTLE